MKNSLVLSFMIYLLVGCGSQDNWDREQRHKDKEYYERIIGLQRQSIQHLERRIELIFESIFLNQLDICKDRIVLDRDATLECLRHSMSFYQHDSEVQKHYQEYLERERNRPHGIRWQDYINPPSSPNRNPDCSRINLKTRG